MNSSPPFHAQPFRLALRVNRLLVLILALVAPASLSAQPTEPPELKIMSYNIRYGTADDGADHWSKRKESLTELIRSHDPDLLGTQETLACQAQYLEHEFPVYESFGVGRDDGKQRGEMVTLFFRRDRFAKVAGGHFWLSKTPEVAGSKSWDSSLTRMVTWVRLTDTQDPAQREFLFLNTHLDHQGGQARLESCRLIRRKIHELQNGAALILTGDFNAGEGSEPYRELFSDQPLPAGGILVDTFRFTHPQRQSDEGTFSNFSATQTTGPRIDWIAVSAELSILAGSIDRSATAGRTPSDHFPVLATVKGK